MILKGCQGTYRPPTVTLTTLGWLKYMEAPAWRHFEHQYLRFPRNSLTKDWQTIQGGVGSETLQKWMNMCRVLELDRKAKVDLFLLAQSGLVGRTLANNLLWNLCSYWALDPTYEDLSHKVSNEVGRLQQYFDRPPAHHHDLKRVVLECL